MTMQRWRFNVPGRGKGGIVLVAPSLEAAWHALRSAETLADVHVEGGPECLGPAAIEPVSLQEVLGTVRGGASR